MIQGSKPPLEDMNGMRMIALVFAAALQACASATKEAKVDEAVPIVIGESRQLQSASLNDTRQYNVWLPASYATSDKRYPVLFLLDGGLDQDFHHIAGLAQYGALSGVFEELIVVGVETRDRRRELTYPSSDPKEREDFPTHGASAAFRTFLVEELKPAVERLYRTDGRDALMGESLAGLFVIESFLKAPGSVDIFIALSPSLWWDAGRLGLGARGALKIGERPPQKIYLGIASEKGAMRKSLLSIVSAIEKEDIVGLAWTFSDRPDLSHANIYHREALEALEWAFPAGS
jgi:hypothetical protein